MVPGPDVITAHWALGDGVELGWLEAFGPLALCQEAREEVLEAVA